MYVDISCFMLIIWTFSHAIGTVTANWDRVCPPHTRRPHREGLCGRQIDEMLSFLCIRGYNEYPTSGFGFRRKRDAQDSYDKSKLGRYLIQRGQANSFLTKRSSYYGQGIVCECCYNSCSIFELSSYCRGGLSLFKRSTDTQKKRLEIERKYKNLFPVT